MATNTISPADHSASLRRRALIAILFATVLQATAQVLMKKGMALMTLANPNPNLIQIGLGIVTIPTLFSAFALYGVFTIIMVWALQHGELSMLYPAMALSYIWVSFLSVEMFGETMNPLKIAGILVIVCGVAVLGLGERESERSVSRPNSEGSK
jgi:multidrug transporter EmrE-like cation transporter